MMPIALQSKIEIQRKDPSNAKVYDRILEQRDINSLVIKDWNSYELYRQKRVWKGIKKNPLIAKTA